MDNTFLTKIVNALGYNIVVNDDDEGEPTAILSPIESEVPADGDNVSQNTNTNNDNGAAVLLAQNAITEIESLRKQLGGEDGITSLIDTINKAKVIVANHEASEDAERNALVSQLVGNTSVYTEDELKGKPVSELRKLTQLMALPDVDYSLTRSGVAHNTEDDLAVPAVFFAPREQAKQ